MHGYHFSIAGTGRARPKLRGDKRIPKSHESPVEYLLIDCTSKLDTRQKFHDTGASLTGYLLYVTRKYEAVILLERWQQHTLQKILNFGECLTGWVLERKYCHLQAGGTYVG